MGLASEGEPGSASEGELRLASEDEPHFASEGEEQLSGATTGTFKKILRYDQFNGNWLR